MRAQSKKIVMVGILLLFWMGCDDDNEQKWLDFSKSVSQAASTSSQVSIDTSEYVGGQLRVSGTCTKEDELLLILPVAEGDKRIIASPRCSHGRYEMISATFGRPPCEISVEFGGDKSIQAPVAGAEMYCP